MRTALACLALLPCSALAEDFTLQTAPDAVTLYAGQALVSRTATLDLPAGRHEIALPGLPLGLSPETLRVALEGATLSSTEFRASAVPPQPPQDDPAILAARARIDAAEEAIAQLEAQKEAAKLTAESVEARAGFLKDLTEAGGLGGDLDKLQSLARLVGEARAAAGRAWIEAEREMREIERTRPPLDRALRDARAALAALTPAPEERAQMTLAVNAAQAGEVEVTLSYRVGASWTPVYDVHLDDGQVTFHRGAQVQQWSGESWEDVALTLSTFRLNDQIAPREVYPIPLTTVDPEEKQSTQMLRREPGAPQAEAMADAAPVMLEESAQVSFDGPGVSYSAPTPVSVASGVDAVRVALDSLTFEAEELARAAPRFDATAFHVARFTNDTREPLLASPSVSLYRDGGLIGQSWLEQVPAGAESELAFGPIEDLQLSYTVLNENAGDRGIINRSNERTEVARMDVENIGQKDWEVEVRAAVPYTTQEDLVIDWEATPAPSSQNIKDKRGVLQWDSTVPAGTTTSIQLETVIRWPEGQVLR
ncbi:MAG: DUF4139 domain-containing protein [Sulfitobacter sp.]|nr:DUF4139 domain-containing protein [Sulfitobacter sp.]